MSEIKKFSPELTTSAKKFDPNSHIREMYKTAEWNDFRIRFLNVNKKCYACGVPAVAVDHLVAHKGDMALFTKPDNMIPLCTKCHNTVTAKFDRFPVQKYVDKLKWFAQQRMIRGLAFPVKVVPYYP